MQSLSEAIAHLIARGYHAQAWEYPATPGALAVASEVIDAGDGLRILRHFVVVLPNEQGWRVCWERAESDHESLDNAVEAAADLVTELKAGGIPYKWLGRTRLVDRSKGYCD